MISRVLGKAARIAFTFVMMNYAAVVGLFSMRHRRRVWR
jgi:hypothetical protein